jgi:hypothetical protein
MELLCNQRLRHLFVAQRAEYLLEDLRSFLSQRPLPGA